VTGSVQTLAAHVAVRRGLRRLCTLLDRAHEAIALVEGVASAAFPFKEQAAGVSPDAQECLLTKAWVLRAAEATELRPCAGRAGALRAGARLLKSRLFSYARAEANKGAGKP